MADLCTLADVHLDPTLAAVGTTLDTFISSLITQVTYDVQRYTGREFVTTTVNPQTRVFDIRNWWVSRVLPVGDMASAPTAVTFTDQFGGAYSTLNVSTDVIALPTFRQPWEPVTDLQFRPSAGALPQGGLVNVTGPWSWPLIPSDVNRAAVDTVIFRLQQSRALTSQSPAQFEDPQGPQRQWPLSARNVWDRYRIWGIA